MKNIKNPALTIEMVPPSSWYNNLRSQLSREQWDTIRKTCYANAGYVCEICGGIGPSHPVECHEIWLYDDESCTQILCGVVALCPQCHAVKHFGLSVNTGKGEECCAHLMKVNGWDLGQLEKYVHEVVQEYEKRKALKWKVDTSFADELLKGGSTVWPKANPEQP